MLRQKAGGRVVTTEVAVDGMLRDLGKERMSFGCFKHDLFNSVLFMVPIWVTGPLMLKIFKSVHRKQLAKAQKEA